MKGKTKGQSGTAVSFGKNAGGNPLPRKRNKGNGCPVFKRCGGCQLRNLTYEEQLSHKQAEEIRLLGRYCHVEEIIGMETPEHYRCKVQAAFGMRGGHILSGIYQSSTHKIVPVDSCLIEDKVCDAVILTIRNLCKKFHIGIFNENTLRGFLRHVLVRRGYFTGMIMVVLVTGEEVFPKKKEFLSELLARHSEITTVVQSVNSRFTPLVLGERFMTLYGPGYIEDELCGCRFRISPASFYQVNPQQTEILYQTALSYMGLTDHTTVIDAYCGTGTIGILAARTALRVIGAELNETAVRDAKINAKMNGTENITFHCEDAGRFMVTMAEAGEHADVVVMDPPRAGCDPQFLRSLAVLSPTRVVYISCNPKTLARDLALLTRSGYRVRRIQPVDMFPHTNHVETICLLSKLNAKQHIEINLDMDELDLTDAEKKATYQEIKDYVLEHSGLKVSSLYIAQVKQKCGIIERENYNKPKSEDAKQPQCPPDKEKAIKEALTHFGMI